MFCAETAESLAPQAWDLKLDDLPDQSIASDVRPQKSKLSLYPVLMFCHFLQGLSRLCLHQLVIKYPLRLKPGLAHLERQLLTVGELLPKTLLPCFVLEIFISLVVQLPMVLHKVHNSLCPSDRCLSSAPSCIMPVMGPPTASVSVSFFSVAGPFFSNSLLLRVCFLRSCYLPPCLLLC